MISVLTGIAHLIYTLAEISLGVGKAGEACPGVGVAQALATRPVLDATLNAGQALVGQLGIAVGQI